MMGRSEVCLGWIVSCPSWAGKGVGTVDLGERVGEGRRV